MSSQDYTYLTIAAGSQDIKTASQQVATLVQGIINDLQDIMDTLSHLSLSWVGKSQQEADKFNQEWQAAIATLFGTKKNPQQGVLTKVVMALSTAAANYATVEFSAEDSCAQFVAAMILQPGNATPPTPQSIENSSSQTVTAITETF